MKLLIEKTNEKVTVETKDLNEAMVVLKYMVEGKYIAPNVPTTLNIPAPKIPTNINIPTPVIPKTPVLDHPERKPYSKPHTRPYEPQPYTRKLSTFSNTTKSPNFVDKEKSDKQLIFFKCKECGTVGCTHQNPNDPVKCYKCQADHELEPLVPGSYYCNCGKICKFVQEESVSAIKCHKCEVEHLMVYVDEDNCYKSLHSVEVQNNG